METDFDRAHLLMGAVVVQLNATDGGYAGLLGQYGMDTLRNSLGGLTDHDGLDVRDHHADGKDKNQHAEHNAQNGVHGVVDSAGHHKRNQRGGRYHSVENAIEHNGSQYDGIEAFAEKVASNRYTDLDENCHRNDDGALHAKPYRLRHCQAVDRSEKEYAAKHHCDGTDDKTSEIFCTAVERFLPGAQHHRQRNRRYDAGDDVEETVDGIQHDTQAVGGQSDVKLGNSKPYVERDDCQNQQNRLFDM